MNVVITAATKGIGKAIALTLAQAGYNLALCSRNQNELDLFKAELNRINPDITVIGLETDCSVIEQLKRFADFVQQHFPVVDVLINNAGIYIPSKILDEADDVMPSQINMNLYAAHFLCRFFGKGMRERKSGHIFNICSIAALKPVVEAGSYTVTKFALLGLTRVLREELLDHQVKVTAILPGSTLTDSWKGTTLHPERFVLPQDVATAVLTCLSLSFGCNIDELIVRPVLGEV